ncbi:MAG: PEP-CTERM sorting domain-containing protein [Pseudomonadales bacterium]|nr:PEP-CTERM sorting domain-containing protein [Pseudomonadales bacterium]
MNFKLLAAATLTSLISINASAIPISDLYNTGESSTAGTIDSNYALSYSGADTTAFGANGYEGTGWPTQGPWIPNNATSQWLTPGPSANTSYDPVSNGTYTWSLTFDLTGYDATSASFDGRWATDNSGTLSLNGDALSNSSASFTSWATFSDLGGSFIAGLNTLEFTLINSAQATGNPAGLRVEFLNSNVNIASVPEPETLSLFGLGLIALGLARKKQKSSRA